MDFYIVFRKVLGVKFIILDWRNGEKLYLVVNFGVELKFNIFYVDLYFFNNMGCLVGECKVGDYKINMVYKLDVLLLNSNLCVSMYFFNYCWKNLFSFVIENVGVE